VSNSDADHEQLEILHETFEWSRTSDNGLRSSRTNIAALEHGVASLTVDNINASLHTQAMCPEEGDYDDWGICGPFEDDEMSLIAARTPPTPSLVSTAQSCAQSCDFVCNEITLCNATHMYDFALPEDNILGSDVRSLVHFPLLFLPLTV
jgi:hypothetical protein